MKTLTSLKLAIVICLNVLYITAQNPAMPANAFGTNHWMPEKYLNFASQRGGGFIPPLSM